MTFIILLTPKKVAIKIAEFQKTGIKTIYYATPKALGTKISSLYVFAVTNALCFVCVSLVTRSVPKCQMKTLISSGFLKNTSGLECQTSTR